jgi:hypothetical protein
MPLKFKIVFYNLMLFLILFDVIYLIVWVMSIEMNPLKAVFVAGITALLMPWAKAVTRENGRKVAIRSLAYDLIRNYKKKNNN